MTRDDEVRRARVVTNLGERDVTLEDLLEGAAASLEHLDLFRHDHDGQQQFKTADGRWFIVEHGVYLTEIASPTCDSCAADLAPEDIGKDGPDRVLCTSCFSLR